MVRNSTQDGAGIFTVGVGHLDSFSACNGLVCLQQHNGRRLKLGNTCSSKCRPFVLALFYLVEEAPPQIIRRCPISARKGASGSQRRADSGICFLLPGSPRGADCVPNLVLLLQPYRIFITRILSCAKRGAALPAGSPPF